MRTHIFNHMTAREIEEYLASGKDSIFVAIGSTGAHGGLPVDAETVLAEGLAVAIAEKCGAVALTGLPFFYPGEAAVSSATVYTSLRDGFEYIWKILVSLTNQGFKRLFLVPSHENITIMLRALTRDFYEQTQFHPVIIDLMSVLTGARKHDSSNMFAAGNNTRMLYEQESQRRLKEALPDAGAYDRLICGAYSIMGKKDELVVDPDLKAPEATELVPEVAGFVNRAKRFRGTAAEMRNASEIGGGCIFKSVEERDQVCSENEKKLRAAIDELPLEYLLKVVEDYQEYSKEVYAKFPRFNKLAER